MDEKNELAKAIESISEQLQGIDYMLEELTKKKKELEKILDEKYSEFSEKLLKEHFDK